MFYYIICFNYEMSCEVDKKMSKTNRECVCVCSATLCQTDSSNMGVSSMAVDSMTVDNTTQDPSRRKSLFNNQNEQDLR